jgi:V/A-type H+-transporting ATPase subunit I
MRFGLGLWELYQFAQGLMGDGLSYLRLFALGLAGGLLGAAFNQIAFMFITTPDGTVNYASVGVIGTILVLIVGHTLNLLLSALGAFVHPLRLIFVEFYNNLEFRGGGVPYSPLSKEVKA